jgi:hypothetical protein
MPMPYDAKTIEREILSTERIDPVALKRTFANALAEARDLFATLQDDIPGALFIDTVGRICNPNPGRSNSGAIQRHKASLGGVWPSIIQDRTSTGSVGLNKD